MKILQVMAGGETGGAETAFIDTCLAMQNNGFTIEAATRKNQRNDRLAAAGIKVHALPFGGGLDFYTLFRLKKIIGDFKPQIVQTWMSRAARLTPANPSQYLKVSRLGNNYGMKYFKTSDYFVTITPAIKNYLMANGIADDRIRQINNFSETQEAPKVLTKTDLDTPEEAVAVLALSRLHDAKALDILIKAVKDLPQFHLWLAGDGPLRGKLEMLAASLGLGNRVHFLGWRDDRSALLNACDICVFPSRFEPFGTVFVQAWAHKVPLIVSNAEGPKQFVRHDEDGIIFPIDDVEALKQALIKISQDKILSDRLVAAGYQRYANEFTIEKTMQAYREFYSDILARETRTR